LQSRELPLPLRPVSRVAEDRDDLRAGADVPDRAKEGSWRPGALAVPENRGRARPQVAPHHGQARDRVGAGKISGRQARPGARGAPLKS
jgi:hypothetical protein